MSGNSGRLKGRGKNSAVISKASLSREVAMEKGYFLNIRVPIDYISRPFFRREVRITGGNSKSLTKSGRAATVLFHDR